MSAAAEARWKQKIQRESNERNRLLREVEAAHMQRGPRMPVQPPKSTTATKAQVRRFMRLHASEYETATALAEAANCEFELPGDGLDDQAHWVWDMAAEEVYATGDSK